MSASIFDDFFLSCGGIRQDRGWTMSTALKASDGTRGRNKNKPRGERTRRHPQPRYGEEFVEEK